MDQMAAPDSQPSALSSIQPPFHNIDGVPNFRCIGGWPISSPASPSVAQHVKSNKIYRGSDPIRITPNGIQSLLTLNITHDFDLRSAQQVEKLGIRDLGNHGIHRVWAPVFAEEDYTEDKARERYELYASDDPQDIVKAFVEILEAGATLMRTVVDYLLRDDIEQPTGFFMHCTTGNNRTGVFVAMLLLLLHVPTEYVIHEYTLSEQGLAATRHLNVERLLKKGAFKECGVEEAKRKCGRMVGARAESMKALIEEVDRKWDGAEGYFMNVVKLSRDEITKMRKILTVQGGGKPAQCS